MIVGKTYISKGQIWVPEFRNQRGTVIKQVSSCSWRVRWWNAYEFDYDITNWEQGYFIPAEVYNVNLILNKYDE